MRLFVALVPPPTALEHLRLALRDAPSLSDAGVRWTGTEQWHVTLGFLGEVDESRLAELEPRLRRAARRSPPLQLRIQGLGAFGSRRRARIVWAGIGGEVAELRRLAARVAAATRRSGIPVESRRWSAHLTLARCRAPVDASTLLDHLGGYSGPSWTADSMLLVRSHLGQGPERRSRYEPLVELGLGDGSAGGG